MDSGKQQVVLVDPNTKETYKVFVNIKDVARIESDSCYRQKVLTDIIKTKNASSCLKPNASNNDVVEMQLMDGDVTITAQLQHA
ncbi:hypothetical protein TSAR_009855 [Trichomalopsis sarcophagae]|uniref:Uncharacterized protein n=1 Tax=Trichomalopsis sarcophagae TaxID=543379 RepID=A0A232EG10_9HYME|nr:hypothetical protein TSAR_009855 [Trichomalopsis sarcophagae]